MTQKGALLVMPDDVVLIGLPTEVESQVRFHLSGRRLTVFAALPTEAAAVLVWVATPDTWREALAWARGGPRVARKIALVAHDCLLDPFTAAAAREAGLEAWVPLTPEDLPFLLREERHFWQPRSAVADPDAAVPAERVIEREVERRVAIGTHPVLVSVCGVGVGVGATTIACALASYTARQGYPTALVEIGGRGLSAVAEPGQWGPKLQAFPDQADVHAVVRMREYPYIVVDAGQVSGAAETVGLPELGVPADLTVLVLPGARWRYKTVYDFFARWPQQTELPAWCLLNGVNDQTRQQAAYLVQSVCTKRGVSLEGMETFPLLPEPWEMPPGAGKPNPALDRVAGVLLRRVLPDPSPRRGPWPAFAGFRVK